MRIFMTGATGYIGGSVAVKLRQLGHEIAGLARSDSGAAELRGLGIHPVRGSLDDLAVIAHSAGDADAVIDAAEANHEGVVVAIADALRGSGKAFIHTSGSGIVATRADGCLVETVYDETTAVVPTLPRMQQRAAIDQVVFDAAREGIRAIVIRPSMIYGGGHGPRRESFQVPALIEQAKLQGIGLHIGPGENRWANVHIDDVVDLYVRALDRGTAGALYYAENGEASLKSVAEAISRMLGFGGRTRVWLPEEAEAAQGVKAHTSFGSNSRVRAVRSRGELGWRPAGASLLHEIESGWYRQVHRGS
jgi:nucleoside-diphosphate-sugar epimerase